MQQALCFLSPIGFLTVRISGTAITAIDFARTDCRDEHPLLKEAQRQLEEYFSGQRKVFDLPLAPSGTAFQQKIWHNLQKIPYGKTCSYKELAQMSGNVKACRAVGMANHNNPIPIVIPCHRVIGTNGKLVGYAGGLDIKQKLLMLEQKATE